MDRTTAHTTGQMGTAGRARHSNATMSVALSLTLAVACAVTSGCATGLDGMRSEMEIPEFRDVAEDERCREESVVLVDTAADGARPVRIAVELRGRGDADRVIVAIHGLLSDTRTWRYIANCLEPDHDLMLVDLPGCGRSDKPAPAEADPDEYSTTNMARRVLIALRHCLALRGDEAPVTVMAHSLGGAVTLRMLGDADLRAEYADVVGRVENVVLISALDVRIEREYQMFRQLAEVTDVEVAIAEALNLLHGKVAEATIEGVADPDRAIREEAEHVIEALCNPASRHAAQWMIRKAVPFLETGRPDWEAIELLERDYGNVDVPCLVIWGARDEALPCSMAYKLQAQLPDARLRVLSRAMHTLPTERPWTCARLVRSFARTNGRGWLAVSELDDDAGPGTDEVALRGPADPVAALR